MWLGQKFLLAFIFIVPVVTSTRKFNNYRRFTFESGDCERNGKNEFKLEKTGIESAVKISAKGILDFRTNFTCEMTVKVPFFFGAIIRVHHIDFPQAFMYCNDYLEVISDESYIYDLCSPRTLNMPFVLNSFFFESNLKIRYHTNNSFRWFDKEGFTLIVTATGIASGPYDKSFRCISNKKKIWEGFICDGYKNCADGSDESPKLCDDTDNPLIIRPVSPITPIRNLFINFGIAFTVFASALFLVLGIYVLGKKFRSRLRNANGITQQGMETIANNSSRNRRNLAATANSTEEDYDRPPPYSMSTNDTTYKPVEFTNPPPYGTVYTNSGNNSFSASELEAFSRNVDQFQTLHHRTNN